MTLERASGVLLHPTSLPGSAGIGDLGKSAFEFLDFLSRSGQKLWQVLPLGPIGYEHSPYTMNYSAFAGNPLLISLDILADEGLLERSELKTIEGKNPEQVDYEQVMPYKREMLARAYDRFQASATGDQLAALDRFCFDQSSWLDDFVLFMALLEANDNKSWNEWDEAIARRETEALEAATKDLQERIRYYQFVQFKFFEQWKLLKSYANDHDIRIIGDVSIYVCHNSADVWAHPKLFKLDPETLTPAYIAGVPPDYFSETGQLWGNPVYNWDRIQQTGYEWWIRRFQTTLEYVDLVRIDHFRGFEAYWQVPAGEKNAINGEWIKAPGQEFFEALGDRLGQLPVLAEDLGIITLEVEELRDRFQFPGMRILQFAFGGDQSTHLPHFHVPNSVVYPGTHDNDTAVGWWKKAGDAEKRHLANYLGYASADEMTQIHWDLIRLTLSSVSYLSILPMQDILGLGGSARMNDPSKNDGNWRWRYSSSDVLTQDISDRLLRLTKLFDR